MATNFLTVSEVSLLMGVSEKFIYRHKEGIPGYFRFAGKILFDKELLLEELKRQAKKSGKTVSALDGSRHGI